MRVGQHIKKSNNNARLSSSGSAANQQNVVIPILYKMSQKLSPVWSRAVITGAQVDTFALSRIKAQELLDGLNLAAH